MERNIGDCSGLSISQNWVNSHKIGARINPNLTYFGLLACSQKYIIIAIFISSISLNKIDFNYGY